MASPVHSKTKRHPLTPLARVASPNVPIARESAAKPVPRDDPRLAPSPSDEQASARLLALCVDDLKIGPVLREPDATFGELATLLQEYPQLAIRHADQLDALVARHLAAAVGREPSAALCVLLTQVLSHGGEAPASVLPRALALLCSLADAPAMLDAFKSILCHAHPTVAEPALAHLLGAPAAAPASAVRRPLWLCASACVEYVFATWPDCALHRHARAVEGALRKLLASPDPCVRGAAEQAVAAVERRHAAEWAALGARLRARPPVPSPAAHTVDAARGLLDTPSSTATTPRAYFNGLGSPPSASCGRDAHTGITPLFEELWLGPSTPAATPRRVESTASPLHGTPLWTASRQRNAATPLHAPLYTPRSRTHHTSPLARSVDWRAVRPWRTPGRVLGHTEPRALAANPPSARPCGTVAPRLARWSPAHWAATAIIAAGDAVCATWTSSVCATWTSAPRLLVRATWTRLYAAAVCACLLVLFTALSPSAVDAPTTAAALARCHVDDQPRLARCHVDDQPRLAYERARAANATAAESTPAVGRRYSPSRAYSPSRSTCQWRRRARRRSRRMRRYSGRG